MNPKKQSSNWYIAATNFLTAGLIALGANILFWAVFVSTVNSLGPVPYTMVKIVVPVVGMLLGTWYSARHISKTYTIQNPNSVIAISTAILVVLQVAVIAYALMTAQSIGTGALVVIGQNILIAVAFYSLSKRYIQAG